jgi:VIT1/CCC1 family predicted Fe2+/Mn2+ transporter
MLKAIARAILMAVAYVVTAVVTLVVGLFMKITHTGGPYAIVGVMMALMVVGEVLHLRELGRLIGIKPGDA